MMIALFAVAVAWKPALQQDTQAYSDTQLGLSFTHPATWINETALEQKNDKKKKKKTDGDTVHFKIPITGASADADLVIMRASFSGSPDTWQQIQVDANKSLNRQVGRQWQQEILGVPLLLTQINYTDNGTAETTLTGLLYTNSANKLLFRLTGPATDFDKAQYEFNQTMLTLHTNDNSLPKAEDPNNPTKVTPKIDPKELKHPIYTLPAPAKPVISPVAIPVVVSTKNVVIHVPEGWTAVKASGPDFDLHNAALPYDIRIHVATPLDSDQPQIALNKVSAASLADFDVVEHRQDDPVKLNAAGCQVTSTWRTGTNAKGRVASMEAAGVKNEFYFIASCRPSTDPIAMAAQRKLIEAMLEHISIEIP